MKNKSMISTKHSWLTEVLYDIKFYADKNNLETLRSQIEFAIVNWEGGDEGKVTSQREKIRLVSSR